MRVRPNPVEALATLIRVEDSAQRRANFRQAVTALAQGAGFALGAPPLDGIAQDVLARAAELALDVGLVDDLDWIAPGAAALALYEISAALPPGKTRRELGRRVFALLYRGTASTFAAVAARMALTSGRPLEAATLRARVGLVFDLPIGSTVNADPLALTLVTRRELRERWIDVAKTGTMPTRRLAAKLIEHAAREAVFRFQQGDQQPHEALRSDGVRAAYASLLADREPLVWRHVAVARGLLAGVDATLRDEIELSLNPGLTPTEWRRAAVSLVALAVTDPEHAARACHKLLEGPIAELDRGLAATLLMGLPRVIEAEPALAEELLDSIARTRRPDVATALAALLDEVREPSFGARAAASARAVLETRTDNQTLRAVSEQALRALDRDGRKEHGAALIKAALTAFETQGAPAAFDLGLRAVQSVERAMDFLAINTEHDDRLLPHVLGRLSDIGAAALESPRLHALLLLGRRPGDTDASVPELDQLYDRLGRWLLHAQSTLPENPSSSRLLAEQRRLRALLHLMDVDESRNEEDRGIRTRVCEAIRLLLTRVRQTAGTPIHRVACATLARALDAAVRESLAEPADLLMILAATVQDIPTYRTIAEASTNPDVRGVTSAYAEFLLEKVRDSTEPPNELLEPEPARVLPLAEPALVAERLVRLSRGLGAGGSYRGEALRRIVLRLGRALEVIAHAHGQSELVDASASGSEPLGEVESAIEDLQRLGSGALRRLIGEDPLDIQVVTELPNISAVIERAVRLGVPPDEDALSMAIGELTSRLPSAIGMAVAQVLSRIHALPVSPASDVFPIALERRRTALPDWLLPHRTIGAFYVVRPLGAGGASSVFLTRRIEERANAKAQGFALKVPDYDPTTARSLSEAQFLQLFREEASALLSLPHHPNLAGFVTFDAGARPKPILVMELIRGPSLDRLIRSRSLGVDHVLSYLDGILCGLGAMHSAGVAHLDVKPSNVILRDGTVPVLVDFGLSGRHLRPGCGTIDYAAPEVLGMVPADWSPSPLPADVYAFACAAFESLTGALLFGGADEGAIVSAHLDHDGWPERLVALAHDPRTARLAKLLAACLRRDPRNRPTVPQAQVSLAALVPALRALPWPLQPSGPIAATAS